MLGDYPSAFKYEQSRNRFRNKANEELFAKHPELASVTGRGAEYLSWCLLSISGAKLKKRKYNSQIVGLMISFLRTHFIALDLIGWGELIEAATLIRKQFELMARLFEIERTADVPSLEGRTPNVSALDLKLRKLYSVYSEIAHSSVSVHLQNLGEVVHEGQSFIAIFPEYHENALVALQHLSLCLFEFERWASPFLTASTDCYDSAEGRKLFLSFAEAYLAAFGEECE